MIDPKSLPPVKDEYMVLLDATQSHYSSMYMFGPEFQRAAKQTEEITEILRQLKKAQEEETP